MHKLIWILKLSLFLLEPKRSASLKLVLLENGSIAVAHENSTIVIWRDSAFETNIKLNGHKDRVKSLAQFGVDLLASGSCDSTIKIWNLTTANSIKNLTEHKGCVNALISFKSLDTTYLLSASDDSSIKIWNSSLDLISTKTSHSGPVTVLAYDAISKYTASGSKDRIISLYTVSLMATLKVNSAHNKKIRAICFLQDGLLASGSEDYEIKIWRYTLSKTLELITTLTEHNGSVNHLEVLSNGSLMSGSNDFTLKIWNKINDTSFVCVATLNHSLQVTSFLTLSNFIISGLVDGSIYIWNEESSIIQLLNNHTKAIVSMVALNNQSFASASVDGSIKIWRIQMQSLFVLIANLDHKSAVYSVKVLRDERLLSSGLGNWILVWQKDTFELIATLREHTNSILRLAVLESGNFISFPYSN